MPRLLALCSSLLFGCSLLNPEPPVDGDRDGSSPPADCDDTLRDVHPGAPELCDGLDNDCDGAVDEGWDEDADGFKTCGAAPDCDDTNPAAFPGAVDVCDGADNDCNGLIDDGDAVDADGDGWCTGVDCDDSDPAIHPEVAELCDGVDQDCNGAIDDGFDEDLDGYAGCGGPDCDDLDPAVNPGAAEVCDGVDQDCDGPIDEDFDLDGDGHSSCSTPPDCDDSAAWVHPGAPEQCNGADDDCDGVVDEDTTEDLDGDGLGACSGDCDDSDPSIHPGALERPGGVDDDCDGEVDEPYEGSLSAAVFGPTASGSASQEHFGQSLSTAGDFNGDGLSDFASGSGSFAVGTGRVHLVLGSVWTAAAPPANVSIHATIDGDAQGVYLGERVDLGDINGDGYDDLIVGKPMFNSDALPTGAVYVWFGGPNPPGGTWSLASADVVIFGEEPTEQCGTAVAALGDVNGDGIGDLGLTCPWYSATAGPFQGRMLTFFGRTNWSPVLDGSDADASVVGATADGGIGQALIGDFDADGDGLMDALLSSSGWSSNAGRVGLLRGGPTRWFPGRSFQAVDALYTGSAGTRLGEHLAAGDGDGDAFDDLLLGSPQAGSTAGTAGAVRGAATMTGGTATSAFSYWVSGSAATEMAGSAAAFVDLDGDGARDVAIGLPGYDGAGGDSGRVLVWYGPLTSLSGSVAPASADLTILGAAQGDFLGGSLVALPDFNGDGAEDLVVASPYAGASASGSVTIVPGF
jgi:hypothetical protein